MDHSECPSFTELSAHLDGELSPTRAAGIDAHVQECIECRGRISELRILSGDLRSWGDGHPSTDVVDQVLDRIKGDSSSRRRQPAVAGFLPLALAASIVLGVGLTLGIRLSHPGPTADLSTAARLAPFGAVPPGNVCLDYPTCYSR